MTTVSILVPKTLGDADLTATSGLTEPDAARGEVAWVAGTYTEGDTYVRVETHRVYTCIKTMSASRAVAPEDDPLYWKEMRPTNMWAAFDGTSNTQSLGTGSVSWTFNTGFSNVLAIYGAVGSTATVEIKDEPSGTVVFGPTDYSILQVPFDEWDYCWGTIRQLDKLLISGLTPYPNAEVTLTMTAGVAESVGAGIVAFGDLASLVPQDPDWPGPNTGASAKPITFSDIDVLFDGTVKIINRRSGTDLSMELTLPDGGGDIALAILQSVLDQPAAVIGTDASGRAGLNSFGIVSGEVFYQDGHQKARVDLKGIA